MPHTRSNRPPGPSTDHSASEQILEHTQVSASAGPSNSGKTKTVAALAVVLAHGKLALADAVGLGRTCKSLGGIAEAAIVRCVSDIRAGDECEVSLRSARAVKSFARFVARRTERWSVDGIDDDDEGDDEDEGDDRIDDDGDLHRDDDDEASTDDSGEEFHSVASGSSPSSPSPVPPKPAPLRTRRLALYIPPSELLDDFPTTSLLFILTVATTSLAHLHIAYAESLLAHDPRIPRAFTALSSLTHLVLSELGPTGCESVRALRATLEHVEVDFDDAWVESVICASFAKPGNTPTSASAPAPTPAAPTVLPDPVPLLVHSMSTLRTLRASNAIIVTVADKLRYPSVRTLALRLAGVPTVTPLVHAFPGVAELYVYTPFDGCGARAPVTLPPRTQPQSPVPPMGHHRNGKRRVRPPLPDIHATREANLSSQLYSSFPPLACVRGFAPGLYALGLSCAVKRLEIGSLSPPSLGGQEAAAVRRLLADTMPSSVSLSLGRGWWASERRKERTRGRERGLRTIFGSASSGDANAAAWSGVSELVVRVEEPGKWTDVTHDLAAMLLPLANTLTTFVLHWDRTSVPFDRTSSDDDMDDYEFPAASSSTSLSSASAPLSPSGSRTERFARQIAEQMPALRYLLLEIVHDRRRPPYQFNFASPPPSLVDCTGTSNTPAAGMSEDGLRRYERRFWRVDRSEGWLCLDPLSEPAARKLMEAEGLTFEDRVRY
ncbi:hypothetical protein OH76DRAFT_1490161 [Lentinus brumalis]|uniref:Uncharacterized protein n=1 Tax=Lentinus brumalis TaxID=2498619 RepID=A0A371CJZ5_9APHY|nr:hypothetical protein OH76DRAFT_1490161 [Polyporus brumalis]